MDISFNSIDLTYHTLDLHLTKNGMLVLGKRQNTKLISEQALKEIIKGAELTLQLYKKYNVVPEAVNREMWNINNQTAKSRITISAELRRKIYEKYDGKCYYCGKDVDDAYQIDHRIPVARGGTNDDDNLVLACAHCNESKNSLSEAGYIINDCDLDRVKKLLKDIKPVMVHTDKVIKEEKDKLDQAMEAADKWRAKAIQKYPEYAELVDYPFLFKEFIQVSSENRKQVVKWCKDSFELAKIGNRKLKADKLTPKYNANPHNEYKIRDYHILEAAMIVAGFKPVDPFKSNQWYKIKYRG